MPSAWEIGFIVVCVVVGALIWFIRSRMNNQTRPSQNQEANSSLIEIADYEAKRQFETNLIEDLKAIEIRRREEGLQAVRNDRLSVQIPKDANTSLR